jgi:hypothetical protein
MHALPTSVFTALLCFTPLISGAQEYRKLVSLETAMEGLYPVAAGRCELVVANLKVDEPCDLARKKGDDEHVYLLTSDKAGQPVLILEGKMSDTDPGWKLIYRKGEQET